MVVSIKDFVRTALLEIAGGVVEAQQASPVSIAPGHVEGILQLQPQTVSFELLVEVSSENTGTLEGKVEVPLLGIVKAGTSIDGSVTRTSANSQKISFSVPVYFQAPREKGNK